MFEINAVLHRKEVSFEPQSYVVEKIIRLSAAEYDRFAQNMMADQDYLKDVGLLRPGDDGKTRCLLVVSDDRKDGILVDTDGGAYARYSAFIPNVHSVIAMERYPALDTLYKRLHAITDFVAMTLDSEHNRQLAEIEVDMRKVVPLFEIKRSWPLVDSIHQMLLDKQVDGIQSIEMDGYSFTFHREAKTPALEADIETRQLGDGQVPGQGVPSAKLEGMAKFVAELLSLNPDRQSTRIDMVKIASLFDVELDSSVMDSVRGMLLEKQLDGVEYIDTHPDAFVFHREEEKPRAFEVHIAGSRLCGDGNVRGEWLTLPAQADALRDLLWRIGVHRPDEKAFAVTDIRLPYDCLGEYVTKSSGLDEMNMLASFMEQMSEYDHKTLQAALTSKVMDIGEGIGALINMLYDDNFYAFELIDVHDAESLGRYYDKENNEVPEGMSHEEYGNSCIQDEKGVFTELGYIKCKYSELERVYTGVSNEYRITQPALQGVRLRSKEPRPAEERPSVLAQIRAARNAPKQPADLEGERVLPFNDFIVKCRMMDEACRQWCAFIDEAPERRDGELFTEFYREICEQKYEEYLSDPAYRDDCNYNAKDYDRTHPPKLDALKKPNKKGGPEL